MILIKMTNATLSDSAEQTARAVKGSSSRRRMKRSGTHRMSVSQTPVGLRVQGNSSTERSPAGGERLPWIEAGRFLAIVAIIWLHVPESSVLARSTIVGRFGVPFFVAVAVFFAFRSADNLGRSVCQYGLARLRTIYVPFLVWTAIYFFVRSAGSCLVSSVTGPELSVALLWNGSAHHLWFLPFIAAATTVAFCTARVIQQMPQLKGPIMVICAAGAMTAAGGAFRGYAESMGYMWQLVGDASPTLLATMIIAIMCSGARVARLSHPFVTAVSFAVFVIAMLVLVLKGRLIWLENVAGLALFLVCFVRKVPRPVQYLSRLGCLTYGVYLCHILFVEGLQDILGSAGFAASVGLDVAVFVLTILLSFGFTWTVRHVRRGTMPNFIFREATVRC